MPPEGFRLAQAVASSYSLDLDALVSIPVALYFARSLDVDLAKNLVPLLESIRRASDQVRVYCQRGQIKVPENRHRLYSFIEPCIVQVPQRNGASFHPKVWILRYVNDSDKVKFRVIVLSRNLTFDRSWDVAYSLEGDTPADPDSPRKRKTRPLADFLTHLFRGESPSWGAAFLRDLETTEFRLEGDEFTDFEFRPMGIPGYGMEALFDDDTYDELLLLSPFLTRNALDIARRHCAGRPRLLSREEELRKLDPAVLGSWDAWHLSGDAVEGEEMLEREASGFGEGIQRQDLHAKVYAYKQGGRAYLVLGSANCSTRGLTGNVEFMIQLEGRNAKMGPARLQDELLSEDSTLFTRFQAKDNALSEEERARLEIEARLDALKTALVLRNIHARAESQSDGNFTVHLDLDLTGLSSPPDISFAAYPFPHLNQMHTLAMGALNQWAVHNLSEMDLSRFLVLSLDHPATGLHRRFVIKMEMTGIPASRESGIFRHILSNSANFFRYLQLLLADDPWGEGGTSVEGQDGIGSWQGMGLSEDTPLFESLLLAVSREPGKLERIRAVMEKVDVEEGEGRIIPADFRILWDTFARFVAGRKA